MFIGHVTERPYQDPSSGYFGAAGLPIKDLTLSNEIYNSKLAAELYNRYIDEYLYAEEVGFDAININEHHSHPLLHGRRDEPGSGDIRPPVQEGQDRAAGQHPAHLGRPPVAGGAVVDNRHDFPGPPGVGFCTRRRQGEYLPQRAAGQQLGAVRGSPRLHHQGLDYPGPIPLGGQALPVPLREPLGPALPEAPPAHLDSRHRQRQDGEVGGGAPLPPT